jgi:hypothetical protein
MQTRHGWSKTPINEAPVGMFVTLLEFNDVASEAEHVSTGGLAGMLDGVDFG